MRRTKELFAIRRGSHRLVVRKRGGGCGAKYFGEIDGVVRVVARSKGDVFRSFIEFTSQEIARQSLQEA